MSHAPAPDVARGSVRKLGRYELHAAIARGGMATVYLGRLHGEVGFSRCVAIKRLHEHLANDPAFLSMFIDEAKLAARVRHPNVVPTLDVGSTDGELFLVMEYIHGESLSRLHSKISKGDVRMPVEVIAAIAIDMLEGLHAAHEAKSERGTPLAIVHRDVSPQNVIVGSDGVSRVFDFGVAKATDRLHSTQDGSVKGKFAYMAPEQLTNEPVDRRADIWAASVVLWELLTGRRLFVGDSPAAIVRKVLSDKPEPPSTHGAPPAFDAILAKGLAVDVAERYPTARAMATAIEESGARASNRAVAEWLESVASDELRERARRVEEMEQGSSQGPPSGWARAETEIELSSSELQSGTRKPTTAALPAPQPWATPPSSNSMNPMISGPPSSDPMIAPASPGMLRDRRKGVILIGALLGLSFLVSMIIVGTMWRSSSPAASSSAPVAPLAQVPTTPAETATASEEPAPPEPAAPTPSVATTATPAVTAPAKRPPPHSKPDPAPKPTTTTKRPDFGTGPW